MRPTELSRHIRCKTDIDVARFAELSLGYDPVARQEVLDGLTYGWRLSVEGVLSSPRLVTGKGNQQDKKNVYWLKMNNNVELGRTWQSGLRNRSSGLRTRSSVNSEDSLRTGLSG